MSNRSAASVVAFSQTTDRDQSSDGVCVGDSWDEIARDDGFFRPRGSMRSLLPSDGFQFCLLIRGNLPGGRRTQISIPWAREKRRQTSLGVRVRTVHGC